MPAQTSISREYRIYLALWRKAYTQPANAEPIIIKCSSRNMAISMRQGMYRAIRPFRNEQMNDEQLKNAAEKFVVYLSKEHHLELKPRTTLEALDSMFDELGIDEEDLLLGDERGADRSLSKFLDQQVDENMKEHAPNKFYSREG